MGRSKSVPRPIRDKQKALPSTEILGRRALAGWSCPNTITLESLQLVLAQEVLLPDPEEVQRELLELQDTDDEEAAATAVAAKRSTRRKPKRLRKSLPKKRSSSSSETVTKPPPPNAKRVRFADDETVSECSAPNDDKMKKALLHWIIPPPQVQILRTTVEENDNNDDDDDDVSALVQQDNSHRSLRRDETAVVVVVRYSHCYQETNEATSAAATVTTTDSTFIVAKLPLPNGVRVEIVANPGHGEGFPVPLPTRLEITTQLGVMDLVRLVLRGHDTAHHTPDWDHPDSSSSSIWHAMGRAVTLHGTMALDLVNQGRADENYRRLCRNDSNHDEDYTWYLQVRLLPAAFDMCCPQYLPTNLRRQSWRQSKRLAPVRDLLMSLAAVSADSSCNLLQDPALPWLSSLSSLKTPASVTAQQVYALTDNVQLRAVTEQQQQNADNKLPALTIPGLLPTLRPYQECAVRWMLQREGQTEDRIHHESSSLPLSSANNNDEWQLAWVVLEQLDDRGTSKLTPLAHWQDSNREPGDGASEMVPGSNRCCAVVFVCPFMGWLAKSVDEAHAMTVPPPSTVNDTDTIGGSSSSSGGIIAEEMGLGKTVEVLACILAHPRPKPALTATTTTPCSSPSAKRKLDFGESRVVSTLASVGSEQESSNNVGAIGIVGDIAEFGDADDDDDSENKLLHEEPKPAHPELEPKSKFTTESASVAVTVTPDRATDAPAPIEERWVDQEVLGSCICSIQISFSTRTKEQPIIICSSCDEPMHRHCAAFISESEMMRNTKPLRLRRRFSEQTLECRVCAEDVCPCCVASPKDPITSSATLIITPVAILSQWKREILKHATTPDGKPLDIAVYEGINMLGKSCGATNDNFKYVHPRHLARADIVLMTYDALLADFGHSDDNRYTGSGETNYFRERKRYRVVPSPLQSIRWWRVCLDEAQRVETPTARSARMALKLTADHRWCVSGTPVGRGRLEDFYGLLLFLRLEPFADRHWFTKCFCHGYRGVSDRIGHLLRNVFWRSTKALECVREQMGIPEQIEKKIVLKFSSIEQFFYQRQLEKTLSTASDISDVEIYGEKRKSAQLNLLAEHMHRLRAACCHPQVGSSGIVQIKKRRIGSGNGDEGTSDAGLVSRVMSMSQILDKLIADAKLKCEEAQRLVFLHTNAMAGIWKLNIEARDRGVDVAHTDSALLRHSCALYEDLIRTGAQNEHPSLAIGEASVSGSVGFRAPHSIVRNGQFVLDWRFNSVAGDVWSRIDFQCTARKINQVRVRSSRDVPQSVVSETSERFHWCTLNPKIVVFQVSSVGAGDEFVDVATLSLPNSSDEEEDWVVDGGFITKKAKSWRVMVKTWHQNDEVEGNPVRNYESVGYYVGMQLELYESDIAVDTLQHIHVLYNAALSFQSLLDLFSDDDEYVDSNIDRNDVKQKIDTMKYKADKMEALYVEEARSVHAVCRRQLEECLTKRQELEQSLLSLKGCDKKKETPRDAWDECWWDDFLTIVRLYGTDSQQAVFCEKLLQELDGFLHRREASGRNGIITFPVFADISGLRLALNMRISAIRDGIGHRTCRKSRAALRAVAEGTSGDTNSGSDARVTRFRCPVGAHARCMNIICGLSPHPSQAELFENSHCKSCKADWGQQGPICRHCKIEEDLDDLNPDQVTVHLLRGVHAMLKGSFGTAILMPPGMDNIAAVVDRANKFFELLQAEKVERLAARRLWRKHLDLLNMLDELKQCRATVRLAYDGEDLTQLTEQELCALVVPMDIAARYHESAAKQAMALGELRRAKETLRYLKNQGSEEGDVHCAVCLSEFKDTSRAFLKCGHSFHLTPCLEKLRGGTVNSLISCPMRCSIRTDPKDVHIATERRGDDGSRSGRLVQGSWGTKVTRLVADILDIRDLGEKGVVFSQWEDMLDIVEQALTENGVPFVRATSLRQIGARTEAFSKQKDCTVLLLNVKNGAEGLTLVEATRVFMVEPLLNCGLDSQAVNRIHRLGQNKKTYVHRYLVADTIEMKIDRLREDTQNVQMEDASHEAKKSVIRAGGIDGGFQSQKELLQILEP